MTPIKVAFGSVPKDSGTFTFYRNLRPALKAYGIDLYCVTVGKKEFDLVEESFIDDGCVLIATESSDIKQQSYEFSAWCEQKSIDIVMAINSVAMLSALPYLPRNIRVVSRCANGFDEGYRITLSGRDRLMGIIALTPRLKDDLVERYAANPDIIHLIPNGIDPAPFQAATRTIDRSAQTATAADSAPLQLSFMGRLEHKQKGVLYLPAIVQELKRLKVNFRLRIAGKGVHRLLLERELKPYIESGEVEMMGAIAKNQVPHFLATTDVFLFTSHFEGCPNALLEAMTAGCAPVVFLIKGITDFLIEHGKSGFVAPMGDCEQFAAHIAHMAASREVQRQVSAAAAASAQARFTSNIAAERYAQLFHSVMQASLPDYQPLPWSKFSVDPVYQKRWTAYLPQSVRTLAKRVVSSRVSV